MSECGGVSTRTAKPFETCLRAAGRLSIEIVDLPRFRSTVDEGRRAADLRRERPGWLTAARRRHAAEQTRRGEQRLVRSWRRCWTRVGFTRPDDGFRQT